MYSFIEQTNNIMGLGNTPSYSAAESLIYGPPAKTTIHEATSDESGETVSTGPYRRHGYQVSGTDAVSTSAVFRVYASNDKNQPRADYQQIAAYNVNRTGIMYSDEWLFEYAYCAITNVSDGTFTVIEKHSP